MKQKVISIVVFFLVVFLTLLPSCTKEQKTVRIALNQYTGDLPFFVAKEKRFFEKQGLKVDFKEMGNSSEALNALLADQVDIVNPISFSAMFAVEAKQPGELKLFQAGGENQDVIGSYLLIPVASKITKLSELKGKKIGTYTGATQLLYLRLFLKEAGFNLQNDVEIVQVDLNLQIQALETGQFDALFTVEPTATIALQKGIAKSLIENPRVKYIVNPFISGSAAVSSKYYKNNPDTVKKVSRAVDEAIDFIRNNDQEIRMILAKYTALDATLAKKTNLLVWYKTIELEDLRPIQKIADLFYESKIINKDIDVSKMFLGKNELL
jgi:NitT/TauT family transport system substrate-binding protein